VTAEDQPRADERIPDLLATPAAVRFVSCEPLLGSIDLTRLFDISRDYECFPLGVPLERVEECEGDVPPRLDLVITGGESGPGARPTWIGDERSLRNQCAVAGVPYFRKQAGDWLHESQDVAGLIAAGRDPFFLWPDGTKSYRVGKRRVEIFGHTRHYGRIREEERCGVKMLRVDIPVDGDPTQHGWRTIYYAATAVFSLALTTRDAVIDANRPYAPPSRLIIAQPVEDDTGCDEEEEG
jgi:hypothetical protein